MGCANLAHAAAALPAADKLSIVAARAPNIGIVTAYNDMLSAHQPYERYPDVIRAAAHALGATAQVAGGVPAMCDGVTQGRPGMELSLFSRDTIAMATAIALTHDIFDAALLLGICDKIVPGPVDRRAPLRPSAVRLRPWRADVERPGQCREDARARAVRARQVGRDALLAAEAASYHGAGHLHLLRHRQQQPDAARGDGAARAGRRLRPSARRLREALTREAVRLVLANARWQHRQPRRRSALQPIGRLVDERSIVNAMVALLATGGSTNHLIHWVAVARAAGILIDWSDFAELSHATPLLARVYPNGSADVNQFQAAGGPGFVIRELLDAGCLHADVANGGGGRPAPTTRACPSAPATGVGWRDLPRRAATTASCGRRARRSATRAA